MWQYHIAVLGGDVIGPEATAEAVHVLQVVAEQFGHRFTFSEALAGQIAIEVEGAPISEETLALCRQSDAVLFGAVGTMDARQAAGGPKPESAILRLRKELALFTNLRPVHPFPALVEASAIRPERLQGVDLMVVRELTGGLYFGKPSEIREDEHGATAVDTMIYSEAEIERVVRYACELARSRRKQVTSVDKANVLSCSRLWRRVAEHVAQDYPDVELHHLLVDACAM